MVRDFHAAFGHPIADGPTMLSPQRVACRSNWMAEEVEEFRQARTVEDQADAMVDLLYFALGTLVELGVEAEPLFHIVQRANMAKLWPDGRPRFHADGKVLKPPDWINPAAVLRAEIARQAGAASASTASTR
ncbi:MAG: HAD family hydrolase [Phycisphaerae bacterium]|jgi:predicted HAD superfamily Cof-like phosphohydrolase